MPCIYILNKCCVINISAGDLLASSPTSLESCEKVKEQIGASPNDKVNLHGWHFQKPHEFSALNLCVSG